jgi:RNA polymerase sigma factor (sigma-70 family)
MAVATTIRTEQAPDVRPEAFEAAMATHWTFYRHLAVVYLGTQDAEDGVQEAFLRAWRARRQFRGDSAALSTWIGVILRRECLSRLRKRLRQAGAVQVGLDWLVAVKTEDDPVRALYAEERHRLVLRYARALPASERNYVERTLAGEQIDQRLPSSKAARHRAVVHLGNRIAACLPIPPARKELHG